VGGVGWCGGGWLVGCGGGVGGGGGGGVGVGGGGGGGGGRDKYMHLLVHKPENEMHYIQIQKIPVVIL